MASFCLFVWVTLKLLYIYKITYQEKVTLEPNIFTYDEAYR